ncbi:MAG: hypothetical protein HY072_04715, partial [Deltaproteobacteria bacterium]|nr:hypothetical protein [Deltaproteobacteria bacterium]
IFPWLQLFPGEIIAWLFRLGPLSIGLIWRIFSGITITTGWYFIFRHYSKKPWLSFMLSVFLFSDAGLLMSKLFFSQALMFIKLISPQNLSSINATSAHHSQLRIITPGLSLWTILLYILMLARSRENPNWKRIFCSGISFGILFHSYFYFWTAAGLGLLVAIMLDCKYWRVYLHTGWIGLLIGLPKLVMDFIFKSSTSSDWLQRSDKFLHIPRFSELIFPKIGPLLLLFALYFVLKHRKDLRFLWAHAAAGLLLFFLSFCFC